MSGDSKPQYPWDAWQLTAYVLDELEPELASQIEAAAQQDKQLSAELVAIRSTLEQVRGVYEAEAHGLNSNASSLGASGLADILRQADKSAASVNVLPKPLSATASTSRKTAWFGLLAMAASLMVALWLTAPAVTNWLVASKDTPPEATAAQRKNQELDSVLKELKQELVTEQAAHRPRGTSSSQVAQALPPANTEIIEAAEDALAAEAIGDELFGDVQIEMVEEIGLVIVRGSQADVERVLEVVEKLKQSNASEGFADNFEAVRSAFEKRDQLFGDTPRSVETASQPMYSGPVVYPSPELWAELSQRRKERSGDAELMDEASLAKHEGLPGYGAEARGMGGLGGSGAGGMMGGGGGMGLGSGDEMGMGGAAYVELARETFTYEGRGPGFLKGESIVTPGGTMPESNADRFGRITENKFERVADAPLSTFSIDVDTASYAKSRQLLMEAHRRPPADAVRIEEFINYFDYEYAGPKVTGSAEDEPFAAHLAVTTCPWRPEHQLVRIALQAPKMDLAKRPHANIVFLLDVSGSMDEPNKLPLVKESMRMLIEQLGENDKVAMVVYAGAAGCVLECTRGDKQTEILSALDRLSAGGSTNGGDGIQLAYNLARDNYIPEGINRVILCTDGDFNVGVTSTESLVDLVVENAKSRTFLTVLGFGMGNTNDAMMEQISNRGNGVYGFVDSWREAKRQMVQQLAGNLVTVAKDVKIQVEFNPAHVKSYRLLGYENRVMAAEDFINDKKDAGEIGAGHRVTALYEIVPVGSESEAGRAAVDELRYQKKDNKQAEPASAVDAKLAETASEPNRDAALVHELLAVNLRYKQPEGDISKLSIFPLEVGAQPFADADQDFRWAVSVAEFAMLLRGSEHTGNANWSGLIEQATSAAGVSPDPQREECLQLMRQAAQLR